MSSSLAVEEFSSCVYESMCVGRIRMQKREHLLGGLLRSDQPEYLWPSNMRRHKEMVSSSGGH